MTEKKKPYHIIIDADGKADGLTDFQIGTLDATYHMLEDLCVSAHSITLIRDFMGRLSKEGREEVVTMSRKIIDMLPPKNVRLSFVMTHILYVNAYSNLFDSGLSAMFNQIKMDRDGVMYGIQRTKMEEEKTDKKIPQKPPQKTSNRIEIA